MNCKVISTGSQGNAVLLNGSILIDCGVPYAKLVPYVKDIKAVLLTHRHSDHFNKRTIKRLAFDRPGLKFFCGSFLVKDLLELIPIRQVFVLGPECEPAILAQTGDTIIKPFHLIHDVENVGWQIMQDGEKALYATDTHHIPIQAKGFDLYMVEANHTEAEIEERRLKKLGSGQMSYESRAAAVHMSRETVLQWLSENADPQKSKIVFLHQHHFKGDEGNER